jgi:translation initiation factor 1 (eIF-1/SUI1)
MAGMCIIDKNKNLESIIQVPTLGKYAEKIKIKTSKRRKTVRIISGISEIETETQQRKSIMEKKKDP